MEEQYEVKGTGGKLTKRSLRSSRVSYTPYSRPPAVRVASDRNKKSGWLSKLLETTASKILPSLFLSSSSSSSKHQDQDQDGDGEGDPSLPEIQQVQLPVSTLTSNELGTSAKTMQQKVDFKNDELALYTTGNLGIAEIEQRMQQQKFSKDETNRLIELLQSRTTDLPDSDSEHAAGVKLEALKVSQGQEDLRKSMKDNSGVQFDSRMTRKSSANFQITANDVTSSPVEIAKAYMDSRTPGTGYDCQTGRLKIEKNSFYTDNSLSKLSFAPVAKSPICWPGAVVQSGNGYYTPRRGSVQHHPTPYLGSLFSKSTSKFQINAERPDRSSNKRSSTQVFGCSMMTPRTKSAVDDGIGSVSSIHCIHQKNFASTFKGAVPSSFIERTGEDGSSQGGFYQSQPAEVVDEEVSRFGVDSTPVHSQSTLMARKILEHLDRSVPSPNEKLQEIKLARMRVPPKSDALVTDGQRNKHDVNISDDQKTRCFVGRDVVSQETADAQKAMLRQSTNTSNSKDQPQPQISKRSIFGLAPGATANSATLQTSENQARPVSFQTSIPDTKPSEKLRTPNNGFFSFTFPTPATSATFSEPPPTPTMASTSATSRTSAPSRTLEADEESIPSFNFGTKSGERLDFSFGSTVETSGVNVTRPTFKFGNKNNIRTSFKHVGGDAVCY